MNMQPRLVNNKWYIEVDAEGLGKVLLLKPGHLPIAIDFNTKEQAQSYIQMKVEGTSYEP